MREDEQPLNRMEYHTYKILKEQNENLKNQITNEQNQIAQLTDELEKYKKSFENFAFILQNQDKKMKELEEDIKNARIRDDNQIFQLRDQLSRFEQRYSQQEKINEIQLSQHVIREPNRFFCDISKQNDGIQQVKIVLDPKFDIKKIDQDIRQNTMNIIVRLESQEISHIIQKQVQLDPQNKQCLAKNEITFQIG